MSYFLAVFSPATHATFAASTRRVMGFKSKHVIAASKVSRGDHLLCYVTQVSCWSGVLRVDGSVVGDATPLFLDRSDPYVLRFPVTPIVWLAANQCVSIREDEVWRGLSFTKKHEGGSTWTGALRTALRRIDDSDAALLLRVLTARANGIGSAG
jgi:hypothetical protein